MAHNKHAQTFIKGTQIAVESVFISRFTMNNIAPKLQKFWTHKIFLQHHIKNAKATKCFLQSAFYTSKERTCKVLPFYDFWFMSYDKFCFPTRSLKFYAYLITKIGNPNLNFNRNQWERCQRRSLLLCRRVHVMNVCMKSLTEITFQGISKDH